MHARKSFLIALLALLLAGPPAYATTVGLSSDAVNSVYAEQKKSEWCWAACIQMVANLYGVDLSQDEVVARTYGPGVNRAGRLDDITACLNGSGTTRNGRSYSISSTMLSNRMLPAALVAELAAGHPVMLGCDAGDSGHAVVCTAVSYDGDADDPTITALTLRDPWPSSENRRSTGRQVVSGADLGPHIMEGWIIHIVVHEADGEIVPAPQGYTFNDSGKTPNPTPSYASNDTKTIPSFTVPSFTMPSATANTFSNAARSSSSTNRRTAPAPWMPQPGDDATANPSRRSTSPDFETIVNGFLALLEPR